MKKVFSFIFSNIFTLSIVVLSYIIPKKKGLLLFSTTDGLYFKDNSKYLYMHILENNKEFSPVWATKSRDLYSSLNDAGLPAVYIYSLKHFVMVLRAHVIITDDTGNPIFLDTLVWFPGRFNCLLTWHGTGFKNIGLMDDKYSRQSYSFRKILFYMREKIYRKYFFVIATSVKDRERKVLCFRNNNVFVTGAPRNDLFFNSGISGSFKKKFNLDQYSKIILYAPTFRENNHFTPFSMNFFGELQNYLEKTNSIFVVKKHKYDKALQIPSGFNNIIDMSDQSLDVQELLSVSDILISDYSGIVSDYVLTERPIIFYIYDYDEYLKSCRTFTYNLKETLPGPFVTHEEYLLKYISNTEWFTDPQYQKKFQDFRNTFQKYSDGASSRRVVDMLSQWYNTGNIEN